ncbi:ComF family protein [Bengtsoniella intestinalis]|uniref:ComF family protein n=1 Tax=Bengtsoniella intestinalis TaxID=3073143 RepID=UPI00391F418F
MRKLTLLWTAMVDWLFPPKCPFCQQVQEAQGVCPVCQKTLPWEPQPLQTMGKLSCASALRYEGLVRESVHRLKFRGARYLAKPMGALMAQTVVESYPDGFDVVSWAPVSNKRRRHRGYDQGQLLAKEMCALWDVVPQKLLQKHTHTPAQSGITDSAARRGNVLGVYGLCKDINVAGKRILLVDDVATTGSTLQECARVLEEAGAKQVLCITLAKTHKRGG